MKKFNRKDLEKFCAESAEQFGEPQLDWSSLTDEELNVQAEWFDYLWDK